MFRLERKKFLALAKRLEQQLLDWMSLVGLAGRQRLKKGVNSKTDVHKKNKTVRNALEAARSAMYNGILPGGGAALLHVSKELDKLLLHVSKEQDKIKVSRSYADVQLGVQLFQHALKMPVCSIASSAGLDGSAIGEKLMEQENPYIGYDPTRGEDVNMIEAGNIDPLSLVI
ncbi:hypothetical protein KPL71_015796 [Citrus sinensis]|nr:hypothetical protein KPL71_015796 [Citrus sinensis]